MAQAGTLILVVGPSGAGKDTLIAEARAALCADDRFVFPRRTITRAGGDGTEDHVSAAPQEFARLERSGAFALTWRAHGLAYGIPADITHDLAAGRHVVVNLSRGAVAGTSFAEARAIVHVTAPAQVLSRRLLERERETQGDIADRLARPGGLDANGIEIHEIVNDGTLEEAVNQFLDILARIAGAGPATFPSPSIRPQGISQMFPKPRSDLKANTADFEVLPHVTANGFREYDARWRFPEEINLMGMQALGMGLGTFMRERAIRPSIVVGHDYRSYSGSLKRALTVGLMTAGCEVYDIGLALSPMAYFAQFELGVPAVAMVTASHNENGWCGVKMGVERPLTFGPDEMTRLKEIVLGGQFRSSGGASYLFVHDMHERYVADLVRTGGRLKRRLKVVAACGNGTAGLFAPAVLEGIGCEVVPLDCTLDYTFPRYNPNPEDMEMLHVLAETVRRTGADLGLGFDGDGDRCGVVDNEGEEIFADKVGVMLARDLSATHPGAQFVVDVKSTGLFMTDPVLIAHGAKTDYWKTGHSYIKRRSNELKALAGFEKSGHYFFNAPLGRGYDDGLVSAIAILQMLDRNPAKTMADLKNDLPKTYGSPTMSPYCGDLEKYKVVERITAEFAEDARRGALILGRTIRDVTTVNGVRVTLEDGTWGLVRASSNKPCLVVVCESPVSEAQMIAMFREIERRLARHPEVGEFDQKI